MFESFKVDVSPDMGMYRLLQSQSYSVHSALSEFVDNSVQSYIDHTENKSSHIKKSPLGLKVTISIDSNKKKITIFDNAFGINRADFQRAIKMGSDTKHKSDSLSKFGVGMKTAAIWFSNKWEIETSALHSNEKLTSQFDLNKLLQNNETKINVSSKEETEKAHYTKITIEDSLRTASKEYYQETVIPHLAETFIKFKDFLLIDILYDNKKLPKKWHKGNKTQKANPYFEPSEVLMYPVCNSKGETIDKKNITWKRKIDLSYKGHKVKGSFRIMKTGSYVKNPGIRLFRNRRVIAGTIVNPNLPETLIGTINKYGRQRLYGELHLDAFDVDFMKTKFIDNLDPLYKIIKEELQEYKLIDQVNNYRTTKDKQESKKETESKIHKPEEESIIKRTPSGEESRKKIKSSNKITKIQQSSQIRSGLEQLTNKKLYHLYNSLCIISLVEHPYLSYIGSWAFLEGLSVLMEKKDSTSFDSFYNGKINEWYNKKSAKKRIHNAIKEIHSKGNFAKHDFEYEFTDAKQLHNEFKVLEDFIIKCINNIRDLEQS